MQNCVKYCTPEERLVVFEELRPHCLSLAKDKYAHHIVIKMLDSGKCFILIRRYGGCSSSVSQQVSDSCHLVQETGPCLLSRDVVRLQNSVLKILFSPENTES